MKFIGPLVSVGFLLSAVVAGATTVYTNQSSFLNDIAPGYYLETFDGITTGQNLPNTLEYSGNGYSYQGVASGGYSYGNGTFYGSYYNYLAGGCCNTSNPILSVTQQGTEIVLNFSSNVTAVGGNFFMVDNDSDVTSGAMYLTLADGTEVELQGGDSYGTTFTLPDGTQVNTSDTPPFTGFTSSEAITSLTIDSNRFTALDNVYVGSSLEALDAQTVPEPRTLVLMLAGLGLLLAGRRWRQRRSV